MPAVNFGAEFMRLKTALICIVLSWPAQAYAQNCGDLYNAIKKAAMYCGFDCDQEAIEPLQQAYERQCIVTVIPLTMFPDDPRPDRPVNVMAREQVIARVAPRPALE